MKLSCKDLSPDSVCHFEVTGSNAREIAEKMMAHAKAEHKEDIEKMNMPEDAMLEMFESKVHE